MAKATKDKILYVEWVDSHAPSDASWHNEEEVEEWMKNEFIIKDVGFLLKETKDAVYLVGGKHDDNDTYQIHYHREISIPKSAIRKRKILK